MNELVFISRSEEDTERLGRALAEAIPDGTVVGLIGTLGAGKTRLVQGIAIACEVPRENVVSPTFVLCHEYYGKRTVFHFDAYRISDSKEFMSLGVDDYFFAPGISVVEWADRVTDVLPADRVEVVIDVEPESVRRITVRALGRRLQELPVKIQAAME